MAIRRTKAPKDSPTFEKLNQERLKECQVTTQSARTTIETSKRLAQESRELIENIQRHRRKAG